MTNASDYTAHVKAANARLDQANKVTLNTDQALAAAQVQATLAAASATGALIDYQKTYTAQIVAAISKVADDAADGGTP